MPGTFSVVVKPVFCKLHRKAVVGRFVQAGDKAFDHLFSQQLHVSKLLNIIQGKFHSTAFLIIFPALAILRFIHLYFSLIGLLDIKVTSKL